MKIVVLRETEGGEARVALVPESVKKLVALKAAVTVESGAGINAARSDDDYRAVGAEVSADRAALLEAADVLVAVNRPEAKDFLRLKRGAVVIGFLRPLDEPAALKRLSLVAWSPAGWRQLKRSSSCSRLRIPSRPAIHSRCERSLPLQAGGARSG